MNYSNLLQIIRNIAIMCAVLLGFSLPISTGLDSILVALLFLTALVGWHVEYPRLIIQNSVAWSAILLFFILFIACLYGTSSHAEGFKVLGKYDDLILVALMLPIFSTAKRRLYGQYAFMTAMGITLTLSFLIWLKAFEHTPFFADRLPDNPVVFKLHITHGILMGFAAFVSAVHSINSRGRTRWIMIAFSLLATFNVLLMTQGRTGYIVILSLATYGIFSLLNWRKFMVGFGILIVASTLIYMTTPKLQSRVILSINEAKNWKPMIGNNLDSSIGTRIDFYTNTIKIIEKNPILGVGTGGFENAYGKEIAGTNMTRSANPHNQFLLFWAQTGVVGLSAFLLLLILAWQSAQRLPTITEMMLARGLIITISVGCLFNSLLLDHTEGLFFAWLSGLLFSGLPKQNQLAKK